ncbi:hypothetical protein V6N13_050059 [Hibiscus sabdariffa]|uniref:Uncharacterized protein n=1 Tax=Hibiscus sabdariffa TaxID=183260 RepID=A0ABR2QVE1_9ROSI
MFNPHDEPVVGVPYFVRVNTYESGVETPDFMSYCLKRLVRFLIFSKHDASLVGETIRSDRYDRILVRWFSCRQSDKIREERVTHPIGLARAMRAGLVSRCINRFKRRR